MTNPSNLFQSNQLESIAINTTINTIIIIFLVKIKYIIMG